MAGGTSQQRSGDSDEMAEQATFVDINVTPMVDIFLVLLVILMATSTAILENSGAGEGAGFRVQLPSSDDPDQFAGQGNELVIAIPDDGAIIVRGEEVSLAELDKILEAEAAEDKDQIVLVQADENARHKAVVEVMEAARKYGLKNLAIATRAQE